MFRLICTLLALVLAAVPAAAQIGAPQAQGARRLAAVKSWGYQLQKVDVEAVARSPYDLVVIDYSRTGDDESRFDRDDLKRMQTKPDGSRRIVIAYLSIGEAESYRFYWNEDWVEAVTVLTAGGAKATKGAAAAPSRALHLPRLAAPAWLGRENDNWSGNYLVRYWDKAWQSIIFGTPQGYLERIVDAGFDGVYLDRVDAFHAVAEERSTAKAEMAAFVTELAAHARRLKPDFVIVPQNAEDLLAVPSYVAAIDGIGKEDLIYGNPVEGQRNAAGITTISASWLSLVTARGLPVLVVEYLADKALAARARTDLTGMGFLPYVAARTLDRLASEADLPAQAAGPSLAPAPAAAPAKAIPAATPKPQQPPQQAAQPAPPQAAVQPPSPPPAGKRIVGAGRAPVVVPPAEK